MARPTLQQWLNAWPYLVRAGNQYQGPCPVCSPVKDPKRSDRFRVLMDGRFFCRHCAPDGGDVNAMKALLEAAGFDGNRKGGTGKPPRKTGVTGLSEWW